MIKKRFEDIQAGEKATFSKTMTEADVFAFAAITGDFNPIHVNAEFAKDSIFKQRVVHGMLTAGLIDQTLTNIGGAGNIHLSQFVKFTAPVHLGDTVTVITGVTVIVGPPMLTTWVCGLLQLPMLSRVRAVMV